MASAIVVRALCTGVTLSNLSIGVDGAGNITVIWRQVESPSGVSNVFLSRSADAGASFSEPVNVTGSSDRRNVYNAPAMPVTPTGSSLHCLPAVGAWDACQHCGSQVR